MAQKAKERRRPQGFKLRDSSLVRGVEARRASEARAFL